MEKITYGFYNSEFGEMILAETDKGVCWLGFMVEGYKGDGYARMLKHFPDASFVKGNIDKLGDKIIKAWEQGKEKNIKLDLRGTEFQKLIWLELLNIKHGDVKSYGDIAVIISKPNAARAVGSAVGKNPVSLIVPCHRIIQKSGAIGNYGWGIEIKRQILNAEGVSSFFN